jgi:hypothetical protein
MHLVQILLPLYDAAGKRFERGAFDRIVQELSERFGGVTLHARAPATRLWKESPDKTARDDIVVCEVMVETLEPEWWRQYRRQLEQTFAQNELVVRSQEIKRL